MCVTIDHIHIICPGLDHIFKIPKDEPSSVNTSIPIISAIKYSFSSSFTCIFPRHKERTPSIFFNFIIVKFFEFKNYKLLKGFRALHFQFYFLPYQEELSCFLKRFTSSVVGNTFTSPRTPCGCVITPTCNKSSIYISLR